MPKHTRADMAQPQPLYAVPSAVFEAQARLTCACRALRAFGTLLEGYDEHVTGMYLNPQNLNQLLNPWVMECEAALDELNSLTQSVAQ